MFFLSQKQACKVHFRYVFFRLLFVRQKKYQQLKDGQFVFCIYFFEQNVEIFPHGEFFFNFLCFQLSISSVNATKPGQIWSHLLIKSLTKNIIFCAMFCHCMTILVIFVIFRILIIILRSLLLDLLFSCSLYGTFKSVFFLILKLFPIFSLL